MCNLGEGFLCILTKSPLKKGKNPPKKNAIIMHFNIIAQKNHLSIVFLKIFFWNFVSSPDPQDCRKTINSWQKSKNALEIYSKSKALYNIDVGKTRFFCWLNTAKSDFWAYRKLLSSCSPYFTTWQFCPEIMKWLVIRMPAERKRLPTSSVR